MADLNFKNIITLLIDFMTYAEGLTGLSGEQKKKFVLDHLRIKIDNVKDPIFRNQLITISMILGDIIDFVIFASRGKLNLNKAKSCFGK